MKTPVLNLLLILFVLACPYALQAQVTLPSIISDNMVLQQNAKVNIWGKANAGEKVSVTASWTSKAYATVAGTNGKWVLKIDTPTATENQSICVKGKNSSVEIKNLLIGEVWLCTGQSNMEFPVSPDPKYKWRLGMIDEAEVLKDADYPTIRLFNVEHQLSGKVELDNCIGAWEICTPERVKTFSAVGFIFGRELAKALRVPVGLIQSAWGGTHAESWTKMSVMKDNPLYTNVLEEFTPEKTKPERVPATLWNGMIAPILGYTIKGNIWYQGESNSGRNKQYQEVFTNMINSWRKEWGMPAMPFYFVQIAPHYQQSAGIREAQLKTFTSNLKNIGMVVTTDVGDSTDIHPRNKRPVGERLAAWALAKQYGKKIPYCGPIYKSMEVKDSKAILSFDYVESGLKTPNDEPLTGFFVAGSDKRFYPAIAIITGDKVEVSSPEVIAPIAVRYGYDTFFRVNLYNAAGFPASPFRTDKFPE